MRSQAEQALLQWLSACWPEVTVIYSPQKENVARPPRPYATVQAYSTSTVGNVESHWLAVEDEEEASHVLRQYVEGVASVNLYADGPQELFDDLRVSLYGGPGKDALLSSGLVIVEIGAEQDIPSSEGATWLRRRQADVRFAHAAHRNTLEPALAGVIAEPLIGEEP